MLNKCLTQISPLYSLPVLCLLPLILTTGLWQKKKQTLLTLFLFITEENIVGAHVWWKSCQNLPQNINHFMAPGKPQRIPVSLYLSQRLMSVYVCVCFPCVPVCWQKCSLLISISLTASETEHFLLVLFESLDTRSQLSSVLVPFPEEVPSAAPINFLPFYFLATRGQRPHLPDKLLVHPLQVGKVNWIRGGDGLTSTYVT